MELLVTFEQLSVAIADVIAHLKTTNCSERKAHMIERDCLIELACLLRFGTDIEDRVN